MSNSAKRSRGQEKHAFSNAEYAGDIARVAQALAQDERAARNARRATMEGQNAEAEDVTQYPPGNKDEQAGGFFACRHGVETDPEKQNLTIGKNCPICSLQVR